MTTMLDRAMAHVEQQPVDTVYTLSELRKAAGIALRSQYKLSQQMLSTGLMVRCPGGYRLPAHLQAFAAERKAAELERKADHERVHGPLSHEELVAVQAFAAEYGREWKQYLSAAWLSHSYKGRQMGGKDSGTLRAIRNQRGHAWLQDYQLSTDAKPAPNMRELARLGFYTWWEEHEDEFDSFEEAHAAFLRAHGAEV